MKRRFFGGGFSLLELLVVVAVIAFAIGLFLPAMGRTCGGGSRQLRDSTQVRGIHQALVTWAQSHKDRYPIPSLLDVNNATVADLGTAKDHTANILSPLVFNGSMSPEILINPAEASGKIHLKEDYEYDSPKAAVDPENALWDPSLSADFTSAAGGNISYAHLLPIAKSTERWANTFSASEVVIGNRGQEIRSVTQHADGTVTPTFALSDSITLLIHGSRTKWEGNIAFNDNHIEFMTQPKVGTYIDGSGKPREDLLFYDEPDDAAGTNAFLGIFIKAGPTRASFKSIWD